MWFISFSLWKRATLFFRCVTSGRVFSIPFPDRLVSFSSIHTKEDCEYSKEDGLVTFRSFSLYTGDQKKRQSGRVKLFSVWIKMLTSSCNPCWRTASGLGYTLSALSLSCVYVFVAFDPLAAFNTWINNTYRHGPMRKKSLSSFKSDDELAKNLKSPFYSNTTTFSSYPEFEIPPCYHFDYISNFRGNAHVTLVNLVTSRSLHVWNLGVGLSSSHRALQSVSLVVCTQIWCLKQQNGSKWV